MILDPSSQGSTAGQSCRQKLPTGSFCRLGKIGPEVVALWSRLLRALPQAEILIGGLPRFAQKLEAAVHAH